MADELPGYFVVPEDVLVVQPRLSLRVKVSEEHQTRRASAVAGPKTLSDYLRPRLPERLSIQRTFDLPLYSWVFF